MKIAIIGMGVAGISVLKEMSRHTIYKEQEMVLYDLPETFGTGLPYQTDSELLLLNQTADSMSMDREDPLDFVKWVEKKKKVQNSEKANLPRTWYGEYLRENMQHAIQQMNAKCIYEEVLKLEQLADGRIEISSASHQEVFDQVHLCTGHLPYQDPYGLLGSPGYIHHPYPAVEKLRQIPAGSRVGIIGTGLTGLDMMRCLSHSNRDIQLSFLSDTGRFSSVRCKKPEVDLRTLTLENLERAKAENDGFVSLDTILEWFQTECEKAKVDAKRVIRKFGKGTKEQLKSQLEDEDQMGGLQAIIHKIDNELADYWMALDEKDKQRFRKEFQDPFLRIRSPFPRKTAEELVEAWETGELAVYGDMRSAKEISGGFEVEVGEGEILSFDYLINATGQNKKVTLSPNQSPLLNHLLNKRIVNPDPCGGLQVMWPESYVLSQRYGVLKNLILHGQWIEGIQFGNNSAAVLLHHAGRVVAREAERMEKERKEEKRGLNVV